MIGYKVVEKKSNGGLWSLAAPMGANVQYIHGCTTVPRPKCGPLLLFRDLSIARSFANRNTRFMKNPTAQIWRVEYTPSNQEQVWSPNYVTPLDLCPEGTVLAESITMICQENLA